MATSASFSPVCFLRTHDAIFVFLTVAKFQAIDRLKLGTQLLTALFIEEDIQTLACANTHVMIALGANIRVFSPAQACTARHRRMGTLCHRPSGTELFLTSERMIDGMSLSTNQLLMLLILQSC